jgi:hypothetical protein
MLTLNHHLDVISNNPTEEELSLLKEYYSFMQQLNELQFLSAESVLTKRIEQKEIQKDIKKYSSLAREANQSSGENRKRLNEAREVFKKSLSEEQLKNFLSVEERASTLFDEKILRQTTYREKLITLVKQAKHSLQVEESSIKEAQPIQ